MVNDNFLKKVINDPGQLILFVMCFIVILIIIILLVQRYKLVNEMNKFCVDAGGSKMTKYHNEWGYYYFKCEGRGDIVFTSDFKNCNEDEWGDSKTTRIKYEEI